MGNRELLNRVMELIRPTIESMEYDLIEAEYQCESGRMVLRLYLDRPGAGIRIEDCERVSRSVSALLDVEDVLSGRYFLEVSSPGIERPLRRACDFERFIGSSAKIRTEQKIDGRRKFAGTIKEVDERYVTIKEGENFIRIPIEGIFKARLQDLKLSGGKKDG